MAAAAERPSLLFLSPWPSTSLSQTPFTYVGLDPAPLVSDPCDLGGDARHGALLLLGNEEER